jgi:hypothetical protein
MVYLSPGNQITPGEIGKFATRIRTFLKGEDGLAAYGQIAMAAQTREMSNRRKHRYAKSSYVIFLDLDDPKVVRDEFSIDGLK